MTLALLIAAVSGYFLKIVTSELYVRFVVYYQRVCLLNGLLTNEQLLP
jgi:hypothetical protein